MSQREAPERVFDEVWRSKRAESEVQKESNRASHLVARRPLIELIEKHLKPGMKVVEVGSGTGYVISELARQRPDCQFVATDLSEESLSLLKETTGGNLSVEKQDVNRLSYEDRSIDLFFSQGLLEHFHDIRTPLAEQWRALRVGGTLLVDVPQKWNPYTLYKARRIRQGNWPYGWETSYSAAELKGLLEELPGSSVTDVLGYGYCYKEDYGFSWLRLQGIRLSLQKKYPQLRWLMKPVGEAILSGHEFFEKRFGERFLANIIVAARKAG